MKIGYWIGFSEDENDPHGEVDSGWPTVWCETCGGPEPIVEESDEQIGVEERAREVHVTRLDCGHEQLRPIRRRPGGLT